ncbi:right-handed parallel beta-helix repeat-containing protein [Actinoplanes sp. NPDC051475]|uniref:right-handed parallel beta-helix repeat-containing protein n=1 Tax=Actinoplanes sp. NPDC051475 TaxID=3157225 RepID=UPI00344CDEE1
MIRQPRRPLRTALRALPAVLIAAASPMLPLGMGTAYAATELPDAPYSLDATVSPAPLSTTDCTADLRCALVASPTGGDDYTVLQNALNAAGTRASAAVVDANGVVVTPALPGTVLLGEGTYSITKPLKLPVNVNLRGSSIKTTAIKIADAAPWSNFGYSFMIRPAADQSLTLEPSPGSVNAVSDLTLNGRCVKGKGGYSETGSKEPTIVPEDLPLSGCESDYATENNAGGGIKVGNRWTVQQVRFTNFNYFKLWVNGTRDAHIVDNRWDNWFGAGSGDEDNIGGGGENTGTVIENNQWDQTIRGNSFDFTHARNVTFRNNKVVANRYYAEQRKVTGYGSVYLESVVGGTFSDNDLKGANIVLKSNSGYSHTGENLNVTNTRDIVVTRNLIHDTFNTAITAVYDDYAGAPTHVRNPGGNNTITDNVITNTAESAILITGVSNADKNAPDTITGNQITNVGVRGSTQYSGFDTVGIAIGIGDGDKVHHNSIVDDQAWPTSWYGMQIGATTSNKNISVTNIELTDATGGWNTTSGLLGGQRKYGTLAALAPTGLTAPNGAFTWSESVAQDPATYSPVGGYRVYRNGVEVAAYPVGSPVIPGNLYSADQSGMENGIAGYTGSGATVAAKTGDAAVGNGSMLVTTGSTTGTVTVAGLAVPVTAGTAYTSVTSFKALTSGGRSVRTGMTWRDATGKSLGKFAPNHRNTVASTGNWVTSSYTYVAPAGAVKAEPFLVIDNSLAGEQHLIDRVGLVAGTNTEGWTDGAWAPGNRYQVVAYRVSDSQNSTAATVIG